MGVLYANLCQALHIGCCKYDNLKIDDFKGKVTESYNDVDKYAQFFEEELKYDYVKKLIDDKPIDFRQKIIKEKDVLLNRCHGLGKNPFTVNVITFSGHGFDYGGDAIAVIPEMPKGSK